MAVLKDRAGDNILHRGTKHYAFMLHTPINQVNFGLLGLTKGDVMLFGEAGNVTKLFFVRNQSINEDLTVNLELVPYDEAVYGTN